MLMVALALGISAAVERYALRGDIGRMNTVFKFYLQIWMLLALVAAVGGVVLILRPKRFTRSTGDRLGDLRRASPAPGWPIRCRRRRRGWTTASIRAAHPRRDGLHDEAVYDDGGPERRKLATYPLDGDYEAIPGCKTTFRGRRWSWRDHPALPLGLARQHLHRVADRNRVGLAPDATAGG